MVFSDTSGLGGLVEDIDFLCTTDSTSYPLKDKARNINRHYYVAISDILKASGRVQFDDPNNTGSPIYTATLVADQKNYALPTNLLKVEAVEVKNSNGDWIRLSEIDEADLTSSITDFQKTSGMPKYYDLKGGQVYLYPAPSSTDTTLSSGLKLHLQREIDTFASTDTTQEPGIAEPFHRILSLGAAYDYLIINSSQDKSDRIFAQYQNLRQELRKFYGDVNRDVQTKFRPAHRTSNYQ